MKLLRPHIYHNGRDGVNGISFSFVFDHSDNFTSSEESIFLGMIRDCCLVEISKRLEYMKDNRLLSNVEINIPIEQINRTLDNDRIANTFENADNKKTLNAFVREEEEKQEYFFRIPVE